MDYKHASTADILEETGARLKAIRIRNKLKQTELAEHLGLSVKAIQTAEGGKNITLKTLIPLLQFYDRIDAFEELLPDTVMSPREIFLNNRDNRKRVR